MATNKETNPHYLSPQEKVDRLIKYHFTNKSLLDKIQNEQEITREFLESLGYDEWQVRSLLNFMHVCS